MSSMAPEVRAIPAQEVKADKCQSAAGPDDIGLAEKPDWFLAYAHLSIGQFLDGMRAIAVQQQRNTNLILQELRKMGTAAVTRDQLDAGLSNLVLTIHNERTAVTQAVNDLIAKVQAGSVPATPADYTAELNQILQAQADAAAATQLATSLDPGAPTIPAAPVTADPTQAGDPTASADPSSTGSAAASTGDTAATS